MITLNVMRRREFICAGAAFLALATLMTMNSMSAPEAGYVGANKCGYTSEGMKCHAEDAIGNQFKIWQSSPHAGAVKTLQSLKAENIAQNVSVTNPSENKKCLKCHTTGGGNSENTKNEGVGCEACHGPGAGYYEASNHIDYIDRKKGYGKAVKNGMYPVLGIENLKKREKMCLRCHDDKRPCMPAETMEIQKQKQTIQSIDKLEKGDINFRHPLRK